MSTQTEHGNVEIRELEKEPDTDHASYDCQAFLPIVAHVLSHLSGGAVRGELSAGDLVSFFFQHLEQLVYNTFSPLLSSIVRLLHYRRAFLYQFLS